jgi:hypothetical protein
MLKRFMSGAAAAVLAAVAVPEVVEAGSEARVGQTPVSASAGPALIPPVPQPARRPPGVDPLKAEASLLVPPVPRPAVRPQRLAALSASTDQQIVPPAPLHITRQQWLAAISELPAAPLEPLAQKLPRPQPKRDAASERLRACLRPAARALLDRIEAEFGAMKIISTCRPGARIAGTGRISKHATGEAIDFDAGKQKAQVVKWLIANHKSGGIMTYADMGHVHVDVGYHFVALGASSGR